MHKWLVGLGSTSVQLGLFRRYGAGLSVSSLFSDGQQCEAER